MKAIRIRKLKPKFDNLYTIGRVAYEASGNEYFLSIASFAGQSMAIGQTWFETFYQYRNEALKAIEKEDCFKYNLVRLNGQKIPALYNSLPL